MARSGYSPDLFAVVVFVVGQAVRVSLAVSRSAAKLGLSQAEPADEPGDGLADLVRAVLLDEVAPADGRLGQVWPGSDDLAAAVVDGLARFGVDEELGHVACGQPLAVLVD